MTTPPPEEDYRSVLYSVDREGRRKWLYVDVFWGAWRRRRAVLAFFLIAFYIALPFFTINGNPLFRIDIAKRYYSILGHVFWPQDFYLILLMILSGIIGTLFLVSLFGRVFCGWLCPHNVFLEMVFRPIEQLLEGPAHRRAYQAARAKEEPNNSLFIRKFLKWVIYIMLCGALANTATALFVGTEAFVYGVIVNPIEHPSAAVFFFIFFGLNMFNFTWFREQTCTIVCPYGRLQTAMLDSDTLNVAYDYTRGEPRGKIKKSASREEVEAQGDCIDCKRCIAVCPTGIDIRNGNQLECIHCTACIDACDAIMEKVGKPIKLIRYASENELEGGRKTFLRPRTIFYFFIFCGLMSALFVSVFTRTDLEVVRLRQKHAPEVQQIDGVNYAMVQLPFWVRNRTMNSLDVTVALPEGSRGMTVMQFPKLNLEPNEAFEESARIFYPVEAFEEKIIEVPLEFRYNGEVQHSLAVKMSRPRLANND